MTLKIKKTKTEITIIPNRPLAMIPQVLIVLTFDLYQDNLRDDKKYEENQDA